MSQVAVQKVDDPNKSLPIFDEIAKRFEAVQKRAFELFEKRGRQLGQDLDDWLKAERELAGWSAAKMAENDGAYDVHITLPGFEAKEVQVTATRSEIIVHAATEEEKKTKKGNVLWTEFDSNNVYRRFEMPKEIDVDKVTASLDNGLLRIHAPGAAEPKRLGAVAVAGGFASQLVNSLVQRGRDVEPSLKEFGVTLGRGAQKVEAVVEEGIAAAFQSAQAPLRKEVQELTHKVEELQAKLDLQAKGH